jgi:hypothetical protein
VQDPQKFAQIKIFGLKIWQPRRLRNAASQQQHFDDRKLEHLKKQLYKLIGPSVGFGDCRSVGSNPARVTKDLIELPCRRGLAITSPPATEEIGAMGCEI